MNEYQSSIRVTDELREIFSKINPYHMSCLYKSAFEQKAKEQLLMFDEPATNEMAETRQENSNKNTSKQNSRKFDNNKKEKRRNSFNGNVFSWSNVYTFLQLQKENQPKSNSELNAWKTCEFLHFPHTDADLLPTELYPQKACKYTYSHGLRRGNRSETTDLDKILSVKEDFEIREDGTPRSCRSAGCSEGTRRAASSVGVRGQSSRAGLDTRIAANRVSSENAKSGRHSQQPLAATVSRKEKQPFQHDKSASAHMQRYREDQINRLQSKNQYLIRNNCPLGKAEVHIGDVRNGACIKTRSVKLSNYRFEINRKLRCRTAKDKQEFVSKSNSTAVQMQLEKTRLEGHGYGISSDTSLMNKSLDNLQLNTGDLPAQPNQWIRAGSKSPRVCRTRPSIPSNARGHVCASAVETPNHLVMIRGCGAREKK